MAQFPLNTLWFKH